MTRAALTIGRMRFERSTIVTLAETPVMDTSDETDNTRPKPKPDGAARTPRADAPTPAVVLRRSIAAALKRVPLSLVFFPSLWSG